MELPQAAEEPAAVVEVDMLLVDSAEEKQYGRGYADKAATESEVKNVAAERVGYRIVAKAFAVNLDVQTVVQDIQLARQGRVRL